MADAWRELARTVPQNLADACISQEAGGLIDLALTKLQAEAELLRTVQSGGDNVVDAVAGYVDPDPAGVRPTALCEDARREIKRCSSLHGLAMCTTLVCIVNLHLEPKEEIRQMWESQNRTALSDANDAQTRLRRATSLCTAADDAIDFAKVLPLGCPLFLAWIRTAEHMTDGAIREINLALGNLQEMRLALFRQFLFIGRVLHLD